MPGGGGIAEFMMVYSSDSIECFAAMRVSKWTVNNGLNLEARF